MSEEKTFKRAVVQWNGLLLLLCDIARDAYPFFYIKKDTHRNAVTCITYRGSMTSTILHVTHFLYVPIPPSLHTNNFAGIRALNWFMYMHKRGVTQRNPFLFRVFCSVSFPVYSYLSDRLDGSQYLWIPVLILKLKVLVFQSALTKVQWQSNKHTYQLKCKYTQVVHEVLVKNLIGYIFRKHYG